MKNKKNNFNFIRIPFHCGISGNEKADQAAHLAREGEETGVNEIGYTTTEDHKNYMKIGNNGRKNNPSY